MPETLVVLLPAIQSAAFMQTKHLNIIQCICNEEIVYLDPLAALLKQRGGQTGKYQTVVSRAT